MHHLNSREEYEQFLEEVVDADPEWVADDPAGVASTLIGGLSGVEPNVGYVRTHGTNDVDERTLSPYDVITFSEQPIEKVKRRRGQPDQRADPVKEFAVYAMYSMAIDLEDQLTNGVTVEHGP